MLTVCTDYGHSFDIVFNAKKCMLMCVGKHYTLLEFRCLFIMLLLQKSLCLNTWVLVLLQIEN